MTVLRVSAAALARSRFGISPVAETLGSIMTLAKPCSDVWWQNWHRSHRPDFDRMRAADRFVDGLVTLLTTSSWLPDFVVIPPGDGMRTTLEAELAEMAATSDDDFLAQLAPAVAASWAVHDLDWLVGRDWGVRAADLFRRFWSTYVEPDWPGRRRLLERDVAYRAGLLAAHGWPRVLEQMTRGSAWEGEDGIRFSRNPGPDVMVADEGMTFVPVSLRSGSWLCEAAPGRLALVYAARGAGTRGSSADDRSLDRLIGVGRARILRELERPGTSSELADALEVSLGTVGGHLAVLRDAGLVDGARLGRRVVYRRTPAAETLLVSAGSSGTDVTPGPAVSSFVVGTRTRGAADSDRGDTG